MTIGLLSNSDVWSDRHKAVALYFDEMALAVPSAWSSVRINEPRTAVKELTDAGLLNVLKYREEDHSQAAAPIIIAVEQWPNELRDAFEFVDYWPRHGKRGCLEEHWFSMDLAETLADAKLGYLKPDQYSGDPFLRTSATLVQIYQSRLSEIVASRLHFSLTGVDHAPFPGASLWGPETVRDVLVSGTFDGATRFHRSTAETGLGLFSIRAVMPTNVESISIPQVLDFRKRNRASLSVFQDFVASTAASKKLAAALADPTTVEAAAIHVRSEYERTIAPEMESLKRSLNRMGVATAWRTMSIRAATPVLLAQGLNALIPDVGIAHVVTSSVGFALAIGKLIYDARIERSEARLASPVNYLLSLRQEDWPRSFEALQTSGPNTHDA